MIWTLILISLFWIPSEGVAAEKVRMAYLIGDLHELAAPVAIEKGFFADEGVEMELVGKFRAGPEEMQAFASGDLDIGYLGEAPATTAVANGAADVQVLAQLNLEGSAVVVRKDSKIKSVSDLKGKVVAIPGHSTVQDFLMNKALSAAGLKRTDVRLIVLKPPEMGPVLQDSQIDAFIAWEPYPSLSLNGGYGRVLTGSADIWPDHPCCVLVAERKFLEKHPETVRAILRAHIRATRFINENPDEAVKIAQKYFGFDEETIRMAIKEIQFEYEPSLKGEEEYVRFLKELGYIDVDPVEFTKKFVNSQMIQNELAKEKKKK